MAIKPTLSEKRVNEIQFSLQKLAIFSQMMVFENGSDLIGTDFRIPFINNFAKRIGKDCKTIQDHICNSGKMSINAKDNEKLEEYSSEIWRVVNLLTGLDVALIKEFADNLEKEFKEIEA